MRTSIKLGSRKLRLLPLSLLPLLLLTATLATATSLPAHAGDGYFYCRSTSASSARVFFSDVIVTNKNYKPDAAQNSFKEYVKSNYGINYLSTGCAVHPLDKNYATTTRQTKRTYYRDNLNYQIIDIPKSAWSGSF